MINCCGCNNEFGSADMVMITDELWDKISENKKDLLCPTCIEERLGREIVIDDFKSEGIPCNVMYLKHNKPELYKSLYTDIQLKFWEAHIWLCNNFFKIDRGDIYSVFKSENFAIFYTRFIGEYMAEVFIQNDYNGKLSIYSILRKKDFDEHGHLYNVITDTLDFEKFKESYKENLKAEIREENINNLLK